MIKAAKARSSIFLLAALSSIATSAGATSARKAEPFEIALDNGDSAGAAKEIDQLYAQDSRSARGKAQLDTSYGRFFAALGQSSTAEPYLIRAIAATPDPAERDRLAYDLAHSREISGLVAKAEADYRRLSDPKVDLVVRRNATLALARLSLGAAPDRAVAMLTPLIENAAAPGERWEAHLLLSRAYAMLGRRTDSAAALESAWQEARFAPIAVDAIAVTAMDMAIDRAAEGDRQGEINLIALGRNQGRFAGVAQIPLCDDRLRPEDSVTVAIAADARGLPIYSAVRASRPGIAQFFTVPLALAHQQVDGSAIYVTLRCRTAMDANTALLDDAPRTLPAWMAEKGLYPPLAPFDASKGDPLVQIQAKISARTAQTGGETVELSPSLLQLAILQAAQSRFTNIDKRVEAKATADRALALLVKAGAPTELVESVRNELTIAFSQNANIADVSGPAALAAMDAITARPQATPVQVLEQFNLTSQWSLRPGQKVALADRVIAFLDMRKVPQGDPVRKAMELRRAAILRDIGTLGGLRERLAANGFAGDLCISADRAPSIPPTAITLTADDYPKDLIRRSVTGSNAVEMTVAADGHIEKQRVIASQPSELFDAVTLSKLGGVTLLPAQRDDKPVACIGSVQMIRWQLPPDMTNFMPQFDGQPMFPWD